MAARRTPAWVAPALAAAALLAVLAWLGARPPKPSGTRRPAATIDTAPAPRPGGQAPAAQARLAVVIDDVGYEMGAVRELLEIDAPLSFAVIPHQRHSRRAAEMVHRRGREVLVHVPMEPLEYPRHDPGEGALLSSMDAGELRRTLGEALDAVPHARGLSNHMGSRLTANLPAMRTLMQVLGERRLYFLDSRTAAGSVALQAAREASVASLERDVFLDARRERGFVEEQLRRAVERARRRGRAVAIGHPHPATLEVLRRELPRLRSRGVRLVFASELASTGGAPPAAGARPAR